MACAIMSRMHRAIRILSTTLMTAGVIVLADVALTLVWAEPVSSVYGSIQQGRAEDELRDLENSLAERPQPDVSRLGSAAAARRLANAFEDELAEGRGIGRIEIPAIGVDAVMVEGTDSSTLQKGPGRYPETGLPGQGTTIGVAGHRTTYLAPFRDVNQLERGDEIAIEMPYGTFTYEVEKTRIVDPEDTEIVRDVGRERLVLTACHPLYSASQRYAVFARLVDVELE